MVRLKTSRKEKLRRRNKRKTKKRQARPSSQVSCSFLVGGIDEALGLANRLAKDGRSFRIITPWFGGEEFDAMLEGGG